MKLIVLCGGRGERLGPLTADKPKPLCAVGKRTILSIALENYQEYEHIFSGGYKGLDLAHHICVNYQGSECYIEEEKLGTGGAVLEIASGIEDDYFAVMNGDTVSKFNLKMAKFTVRKNLAVVFTGLSVLDGKRANAGVYLFHRDFLRYIPDSPYHLEDAIAACAKDGLVQYVNSNSQFLDLGTPEGIERYNLVNS